MTEKQTAWQQNDKSAIVRRQLWNAKMHINEPCMQTSEQAGRQAGGQPTNQINSITFARTRFFATLEWPGGKITSPSVSWLLGYLRRKFQRLPLGFQELGIQQSYSLYCVM